MGGFHVLIMKDADKLQLKGSKPRNGGRICKHRVKGKRTRFAGISTIVCFLSLV